MGRAYLGLLVVLVSSGACKRAEADTTRPDAPETSEGDRADASAREAKSEPEPDSFSVTVSSLCTKSWHVSLLLGDKDESPSADDQFEATAQARTLELRPGDALVLTSDGGGIMAIDFEGVTSGQAATIEIGEDCTSVSRTVSQAPAP